MRFKKIRKRDGRIEEFNAEKITNAIAKAGAATQEFGRDVAKKLTLKVLSLAEEVIKSDIPTVEEIQDIVEEVLLTSPYKKTAKAYIIYRDQHAKIREIVERADVSLVDQYIQKLDWQVRENSNMTFSLQGLNNYISSQISRIYWLNKIYPPEVKRAHVEGDFHIHDLNLLAVYTYYGKEVVIAYVNGLKLLSFEQLYEIVDEKEELLSERDSAFAKYPKNVFVLDREGFVRVKRIVKKRKDRRMRFIRNEGGRSVIVTEDHPMITEKGEKIASEVVANKDKTLTVDIKSLLKDEKLFYKNEIDLLEELKKRMLSGDRLCQIHQIYQIYFNGVPIEEAGETSEDGILHTKKFTIRRKIALNEDFGYFIGSVLAEGFVNKNGLCILFSKEKEKLLKVHRALLDLGISSGLCGKERDVSARYNARYNARGYLIIKNPFLEFLFDEVFKIKWDHRTLPVDILQYNKNFINGVICGLLDGDGTFESEMALRSLRSRTLLEQLSIVLSLLSRGRVQCVSRGRKIVPHVGKTDRLLSDAKVLACHDECGWHNVINNEETEIPDDFIYDVTTESGTLVVNGMWNHNCVGWDLYDLLLKGFGGVPGKIESKPARHFRSALGQVVNFFYTLQGECYSADTQVLTESGWKYFWEVKREDRVFTLNLQKNEIELQNPVRFYEFYFDGFLYNFKSEELDILVTPNHNMLVCDGDICDGGYKKFVKASEFDADRHFIPGGGAVWVGEEKKLFFLPPAKLHFKRGAKEADDLQEESAEKIPMEEWLKFFGLWLAEGSLRKRGKDGDDDNCDYDNYDNHHNDNEHVIIISKSEKSSEIENTLRRFNYTKRERWGKIEFVIRDKRLSLYLKKFGNHKYVPHEIKNLTGEQLKILFDALMREEGHGKERIKYHTKSEKLADDIQEIALKLGLSANICRRNSVYVVNISKRKNFKICKNKKVKYAGKVYCLEVPNHVLYVRRNGKACWCGNSAGAQAFSNFDSLLSPFIRYDGLSMRDVEQALQEFVFNINVPTRVGFQCLSEDTKILTPDGWKGYEEIREGDIVYTFNTKTGKLESKKVTYVFKRYYEGYMYNLRGKYQDQLISPGHRVVMKKRNNEYVLQPVEHIPPDVIIPVSADNEREDLPVSDDFIRMAAWIFSDGIEHSDVICQPCKQKIELPKVRLTKEACKQSAWLFKLSRRQAEIFLETCAALNGGKSKHKIICAADEKKAEIIAAVAVLAGYKCSVKKTQNVWHVVLTRSKHDRILDIKKVRYRGVIWSVHTSNETVVAMRGSNVFITGNTPFTNVTLDMSVPSTLADMPVIIGGEPQNETYSDFQDEIEMFNCAFLKVLLEGDARGRVFTFPIPTYNITRDFRWESECAELLWKVTAKYGIPYFSNFINSDMRPEDARSMCCRLRLELDKLERRGGGLFGSSPMTGSIGVVTINMPRLGYLSRDEDEFLERLERLMVLARESLEIKRKVLERFTERDLYPYSKYYLSAVKERFGEYWKNHFSTVGLVGMNEACLNLLGENIASPDGIKFTLSVLNFMRSKLVEFQEETGNLYNLEATPAEGCSYRLALLDKERFPDIICANEESYKRGAEPFYTNSSQLPVNYTDDVFEALELQEEIQTKYTGGTVFHVYVGENITDGGVIKNLVRKICENFRIPYFTITPVFSICPSHGYLAGSQEKCPHCGRECEVYSRVVGYLRPVSQWNAGKQEEFKMRKTFRIS